MNRALTAAALLSLKLAPAVHAQGFLRWPQGPRAMAMGGTGAGLATGPDAAFHAPAGIVWLPGTQLTGGGGIGTSGGSFHDFSAGDFERETLPRVAPYAFATHAIGRDLSGGISFTSPWGIGVEWEDPDSFAGRFLTTGTRLSSLAATPVLAYRPGERWSASLGVRIVYLRMDRDRLAHDPELSALGGGGPIPLARAAYDLDGNGIGWSAGVFVRPRPAVSLGAVWWSPVDVPLDGLVHYTIVAPQALQELVRGDRTVGEILAETYVDQNARLELSLPGLLTLGASWEPVPWITLAADVQRVGWGKLEALAFTPLMSAPVDSVALDYEDVWAFRLGVEARRWEGLAVRLGYAREETPAPRGGVTPLFPDAEREALSVGLGATWRDLGLDFAYRLTVLDDREGIALPDGPGAPDGVYESTEHDFALSVTRRF
jgi:long-chain fatty acid transport protein